MTLPSGHREIVVWIRGYDPEFPTTYRLRTPLALPPDAIVSAQPADTGLPRHVHSSWIVTTNEAVTTWPRR